MIFFNNILILRTMKNIFKSLAIVAVVAIAGYNVSQSKVETYGMSDTMLANVEALAGCERVNYVTYYRHYGAENGCHCLHCPEIGDTSCKCQW